MFLSKSRGTHPTGQIYRHGGDSPHPAPAAHLFFLFGTAVKKTPYIPHVPCVRNLVIHAKSPRPSPTVPRLVPQSRLYRKNGLSGPTVADFAHRTFVLVWVAVPADENLHTTGASRPVLLEAKLLFAWEPIKRALADVVTGEWKVVACSRDRQTGLVIDVAIARRTIRHRDPLEAALLLIAQPIKLGLVERS